MAGKKRKRTVSDFKEHLLEVAGAKEYFNFVNRSKEHMKFWHKLNKLGARNIKTIPPEIVPDIDATVSLSEKEWDELESELQELL